MRSIAALAFVLLTACPGSSGTPSGSTDTDEDTVEATEVEDNSFSCLELTCQEGQFCSVTIGGVRPIDGDDGRYPSCQTIPETCYENPTCDCFYDEGVCSRFAGDCDESGDLPVCTIYAP